MVLAVALAAAASILFPRIPAEWPARLLSAGWMPHQIVQLLEFSNDIQVALLANRLSGPHPGIALVIITDETLAELPYVSPIDRGVIAGLVKAADGLGARVIGLDILFDQATEPEKDTLLQERLKLTRAALVLGGADERTPMPDRRRKWQSEFLVESGRPTGFLNLRYDVREAAGTHVVRYRAKAEPVSQLTLSFAEVLARQSGVGILPHSRRIAWLRPPLTGGETFLTLDAESLLAADKEPDGILARALSEQLDGRIVLIGADLDGRDRHPTPLSLVDERDMLGVAVHAQILAGLLDGRTLRDMHAVGVAALIGGATFLGALIGWFAARRRLVLTLLIAGGTLLAMAVSAIILWQFAAIVPVAGIVGSLVGAAMATRLARGYLFLD